MTGAESPPAARPGPPDRGVPQPVTISALPGIPEVRAGDDLPALLLAAVSAAGLTVADGDVLVVSSKIASKALGLQTHGTDRTAVVTSQTRRVVAERDSGGHLTRIVHAVAGPVMAAAGVDASNTGGQDVLLLLPPEPDRLCRQLHASIAAATGRTRFAVVLTDTAGRPWRAGQVDFALGSYGLRVLDDLRGSVDGDGRPLSVTARAVADEVAAAADLVKGKADHLPAALVRGLARHVDPTADGASALIRAGDEDWFALGDQEAVRAALGAPPGSARATQTGVRSTAPEDEATRVARAVRVALPDPPPDWAAGVRVTGGRWGTEPVVVDGPDPVRVGVVASRLSVALAGEGIGHTLELQATRALLHAAAPAP